MRYDLPEGATVSLRVFDVSGTLVRTLVEGWRGPGVHNETWDGRADDGSSLASGIYFYSIKAGELEATKKMLLLR
jgi:flagellar hook assembly protein FlgD